ncbi:MAG: lipoyl(octanoyl) transferase LipB [Sumerlaeia bacterium]
MTDQGAFGPASEKTALLVNLGRMDYQAAWDVQQRIQERQIAGELGHVVLMVEHPPTITLGRRGKTDDLVAPASVLERRGIAVTETDRGGQVTYHGPGQLVVYPQVNLQRLELDLHAYMRALEESVIVYLATVGITGTRIKDFVGVWVTGEKVCAMGVRVRKWWTMHGLALNVATDLNHFGMIVPCGIRNKGVTSLAKILGPDAPAFETVRCEFPAHLAKALGLAVQAVDFQDFEKRIGASGAL